MNFIEDTRLLDVVERFGSGNWKDIVKLVDVKSDLVIDQVVATREPLP